MIREEEFKSIMEYTGEQLRKQYANMVYENGYGIQAVAKAFIETLPILIKYEEWSAIEDRLNAEWCKGYETRVKQEKEYSQQEDNYRRDS